MELSKFHLKYFAFELTRRFPSNSLQKFAASLSDAQVDLNPHQVDAALFAFKSPLSKGAILADEVGLGKTIEAGIILSQKWAERKRKLLIICPANLRKQWSQELSDKFFLPSFILESKSFNEETVKGNFNPFEQSQIVICSYQFIKSKEAYVRHIQWDLVVIDEAHRLRNVYKPTNKIANTIRNSLLHVEKKILLTATPLQNSLLELYGLVSIIDDFAFGDLKSFKNQFSRFSEEEQNYSELRRRLEPICKRTLRRQVIEYVNYTNRTPIVEEFYPTEDEEKLYNLVTDYLSRPNLYALPPSQRQLMTLILRKLLASSTYAISGTLEALSSKLTELIKTHTEPQFEPAINEEFETYNELKDEWEDDDSAYIKKEPRVFNESELEEMGQEIEDLKQFHALAKSIKQNSKGTKLITALNKGFEKLQELGAEKKAIIFTESTRTQIYLKDILEANGFKDELVLFNGSNNDPLSKTVYNNWIQQHKGSDRVTGSKTVDMRAALVEYFRDTATIMIATEAAAEGINLQFCSLVVNYDLPWNPQRIEQRIGRCHRYGQKFDVVVVNFLNRSNEAEQRVYDLLNNKFKLFNGVFGASDEVLGTIESGLDFEKRIAKIYQVCRKPSEIKFAFDELQRELEIDITSRLTQTRQKLLENFDEDVNAKLKLSLQESRENLNRYDQTLWALTTQYLKSFANFDDSQKTFTLNSNPFPSKNIHPGPYKMGKNIEDANIYRVGHSLAKSIIEECKGFNLPISEVVFDYSNCGKIISVMQPLIGQSGWLQVSALTISSFEGEDYLLLSGRIDSGLEMDPELCQKFFSLPIANSVDYNQPSLVLPFEALDLIKELNYAQQLDIIDENKGRNSEFFNEEMDKLEKWSEDKKNSLFAELKEIEKEIKFRKTEARKVLNLEIKVREQRIIKELEKKLNEKRQTLFTAQDDIDKKKETLLDEIEARLKQKIEVRELFTINWKVI
jgi:ERCC4-related helicase